MTDQEKTRTIYIREAYEAYIEAEVMVTEEEYAALKAASARGDRAFIEAWNDRVQRDEEDLDWEMAGSDFDSSELSSILDEERDDLWYAQYIPPLAETPATPAAGHKDATVVIVAEDVELVLTALEDAADAAESRHADAASRLREYGIVIAEAGMAANDDGGVTVCFSCGKSDEVEEDERGLHYCRRCDLWLDHLTEDCDECKGELQV